MKVGELIRKLKGCDESLEVFVSQAFISSNQMPIRTIDITRNGIVFKDHYITIAEPETFKAFDGSTYGVPVVNERMVK